MCSVLCAVKLFLPFDVRSIRVVRRPKNQHYTLLNSWIIYVRARAHYYFIVIVIKNIAKGSIKAFRPYTYIQYYRIPNPNRWYTNSVRDNRQYLITKTIIIYDSKL